MLKYMLITAVLVLAGCSTDPLEVQTIETSEAAAADGLEPLTLPDNPPGWTMEDGVLTATAPAELELLPGHDAITLAFSFRLDAAGEAALLLGGSHALKLPSLDLDTLADKRNAVSVTPGVWQNLEVAYLPAAGQDPPLLVATYLNGNLIYYQQPLPRTGMTSGPLRLELSAGSLSLTNLRTLGQAGRSSTLASNGDVELNLPLIRYAYYDIADNPQDVTDFAGRTPAKEGYISRFDLDGIREKGSGYAVRFTSDLHIPKAGTYTFKLRTPSSTRFFIDDELVVDHGGRGVEGIDAQATVELGEGNHDIRLDHYQYGGWNFLKVQYAAEGQELTSFNDMPEDRAVATPGSGEALEVAADDRPYLLRSFLNFPPARVYDFTDKRTHVINVGEASGPHYSYDLRTGSLLQAWRGKFVDVSDMWVGRGEPQVARALGPVVAFDGRPQWSTEGDQWPQTESDDFRHLRYELGPEGRPTFYFTTPGGGELTDEIVPTEEGLQRTLTNRSDGETLMTNIVAASRIRETAPGTFELVDPGLNVRIDHLAAGGLRLLRGTGTERLVAEIPPGEHLTYSLGW